MMYDSVDDAILPAKHFEKNTCFNFFIFSTMGYQLYNYRSFPYRKKNMK